MHSGMFKVVACEVRCNPCALSFSAPEPAELVMPTARKLPRISISSCRLTTCISVRICDQCSRIQDPEFERVLHRTRLWLLHCGTVLESFAVILKRCLHQKLYAQLRNGELRRHS